MRLFRNPAKDAKKIQDTIDYRILKAAWDCQASINVGSAAATHGATTPAWFALFAIQNYNGDFNKFSVEELHLLRSLTNISAIYDQIIDSLVPNSRNEELGRHILNTNPILQDIVPKKYNNPLRINEYIIIVINKYEHMLIEFYNKYRVKINEAVEKLEKRKAAEAKRNDADNIGDEPDLLSRKEA